MPFPDAAVPFENVSTKLKILHGTREAILFLFNYLGFWLQNSVKLTQLIRRQVTNPFRYEDFNKAMINHIIS